VLTSIKRAPTLRPLKSSITNFTLKNVKCSQCHGLRMDVLVGVLIPTHMVGSSVLMVFKKIARSTAQPDIKVSVSTNDDVTSVHTCHSVESLSVDLYHNERHPQDCFDQPSSGLDN